MREYGVCGICGSRVRLDKLNGCLCVHCIDDMEKERKRESNNFEFDPQEEFENEK